MTKFIWISHKNEMLITVTALQKERKELFPQKKRLQNRIDNLSMSAYTISSYMFKGETVVY